MDVNPFDDNDLDQLVLVNDEGLHSLWPAVLDVPAGWAVVFGPAARSACVAVVNERWTDQRPRRRTARSAEPGA
ncbi:MbtH family protein [Saccharothrix australiensis]|uniref:MbtH protein n=1 Tax=Saccharothrix australiensis TaxID=2072 RepID=A0A495W1S3_9PSEU|nr:MbtH family protein [Saccharothrix australiensis]RKT54665.1 MbtH protein [Saccharothrix australiensis]